MGSIRQQDKIGSITNAGLLISLGASRLTIGGQQYVTSSAISATLSSPTASSLYMVYAVLVNGTVTLTFSTNVNSIGPTGFTAWKLVGALYVNSTSTFGSFVNINGIPRSDPFATAATITNMTGFASGPVASVWRDGSNIRGQISVAKNGSAGVGATAVVFNLTAFLMDTSRQTPNAATWSTGSALPYGINGDVGFGKTIQADQGTSGGWSLIKTATGSSVTGADFSAGSQVNIVLDAPIQGWSNTPLVDL